MGKYRIGKEQLFLCGWALVLIYYLFINSSELAYIAVLKESRLLFFIVIEVLWFRVILLDRYSGKTLIMIALCSCIIAIMAYITSDSQVPILTVTFIVAAKRIDIEKFIRFDFKIRTLIFIMLLLLSLTNIIDNYATLINGVYKYAFGWKHPNTCASTLILIALELMYIKYENFKLRHWFLVVSILAFISIFCAARTSMFAFVIVCIWFLLVQNKKIYTGIVKKLCESIFVPLYPIMFAVSFILVELYRLNIPFVKRVDAYMTHRLLFANYYLAEYGFSLFGQTISVVGSRDAALLGDSYVGLDMAFISMAIHSGVLYSILFIVLYTIIIYNLLKKEKYKELLFVFFFAFVGLASTAMLMFYRNYSIIFIWLAIAKETATKENQDFIQG